MNFRQEENGTVHAIFRPEELASLVGVVRTSEEARVAGLKQSVKDNLKVVAEAEKELLTPLKEIN